MDLVGPMQFRSLARLQNLQDSMQNVWCLHHERCLIERMEAWTSFRMSACAAGGNSLWVFGSCLPCERSGFRWRFGPHVNHFCGTVSVKVSGQPVCSPSPLCPWLSMCGMQALGCEPSESSASCIRAAQVSPGLYALAHMYIAPSTHQAHECAACPLCMCCTNIWESLLQFAKMHEESNHPHCYE